MNKCEYCGKETKNPKFCCRICANNGLRRGKPSWNFGNDSKITYVCSICGKDFKAKKSAYRKYCSQKCSNLALKLKIRNTSGMFQKGDNPWNIGLTKETDERVAQYSKKDSVSHKGKIPSEKTRKIWSTQRIGHPCYNPNGYGKAGFRKDLNQFFRSTWEANIARILNYLNIKWEYEKHRIYFDGGSILPDFWLSEALFDVEVKGWDVDNKLSKLFGSQPDYPIKIIDGEVYNKLTKMFKNNISNWE